MAELLRWPRVSFPHAVQLTARNVTLYRRAWRGTLLPNFLEPLLYLTSIGVGLGVYVGEQVLGTTYLAFIAPGLAAAAAMNGAIFESTWNTFEKLRFAQLYDAIITTPLEPQDVAAGELLWAALRSAVYGTAFLAILALLGHTRGPSALLAIPAFPLIGLVFALAGMIYTSLIRVVDQFSYFFSLFTLPQFLFSGIFFPVEQLPAPLERLAWLAPLHHGVELCRTFVLGGDPVAAGGHALWLAAVSFLLYPLAVNLLRRRMVT